jgi:hypothetical protein
MCGIIGLAVVALIALTNLNPGLWQAMKGAGIRTNSAMAYIAISQPQAVHALLEGELEEVASDDPGVDLWSPDRFREARSINESCWTRSNYGLLRIDRRGGRSYLELSPNGNHTVWETYGELTAATEQSVAAAGKPNLETFLSGGRVAWGTLSVHLAGRNPDDATAIAAMFIPYGTPEDFVLTPDE